MLKGEKNQNWNNLQFWSFENLKKIMGFVKELAKNSVVQCRLFDQFFGFFQNCGYVKLVFLNFLKTISQGPYT